MVVELADEPLRPPWPQFAARLTEPSGGHPTAGARNEVDGLVEQLDARRGLAEAQTGEREVAAHDAALHGVPRRVQRGQRPGELLVGPRSIAAVQSAEALEAAQSVDREAGRGPAGTVLVEPQPGAVEAPLRTRNSPLVREAVTGLLRRARNDSSRRELRGMAYRMGLGVG